MNDRESMENNPYKKTTYVEKHLQFHKPHKKSIAETLTKYTKTYNQLTSKIFEINWKFKLIRKTYRCGYGQGHVGVENIYEDKDGNRHKEKIWWYSWSAQSVEEYEKAILSIGKREANYEQITAPLKAKLAIAQREWIAYLKKNNENYCKYENKLTDLHQQLDKLIAEFREILIANKEASNNSSLVDKNDEIFYNSDYLNQAIANGKIKQVKLCIKAGAIITSSTRQLIKTCECPFIKSYLEVSQTTTSLKSSPSASCSNSTSTSYQPEDDDMSNDDTSSSCRIM